MTANFSAALFAAFCAVVLPSAGIAEQQAGTSTETADDLKVIRERAAQVPDLLPFLNGLIEMKSGNTATDTRQMLLEQMTQGVSGRSGRLLLPVDIQMFSMVDTATRRGMFIGNILSADLDGDWKITQRELKTTLQSSGNNGRMAAEAFIMNDTDGNGILSTDEVRAFVDSKTDEGLGRGELAGRMMAVFDFDGDGILTQAELDRALKALGA